MKKKMMKALTVLGGLACLFTGCSDDYKFSHDELYRNGYAALVGEHPYIASDTIDTLDVIRLSKTEYQVRFFEVRGGEPSDLYTIHLNFSKDYDGNIVYEYSVDTKFNF